MQVEKTIFISYRRTNIYTAQAVYQNLTARGYDVFLDYETIDSGAFEQVILNQIAARAHFLIILTPSALERCNEPGDWLRREIEYALDLKRNVVPLMFEGFNFGAMSKYLTDRLSVLQQYNGLRIYAEYFDEAMERLRNRYLNKPLEMILHPAPLADQAVVDEIQAAAAQQPTVTGQQLTAEECFERGLARDETDYDGKIADYTEAISLKPQFVSAYNNRGNARSDKGDLDSAIADYNQAILLNSSYALAYSNRGEVYYELDDTDRALEDFRQANELAPSFEPALAGLAITHHALRNLQQARDYWKLLIALEHRYEDPEWAGKNLNWREPLIEAARKLTAEL